MQAMMIKLKLLDRRVRDAARRGWIGGVSRRLLRTSGAWRMRCRRRWRARIQRLEWRRRWTKTALHRCTTTRPD